MLFRSFDGERLQQALSNLLNNAVQHGDRSQPITLSAHGDAEKVAVQVRNHGRPIPLDQLQVIFNPLVQIAESQSEPDQRTTTSLGLGLYIAREIVTGHGGTIHVTSTAEDGTAFVVEIPRG